jgi:hypothetical protein
VRERIRGVIAQKTFWRAMLLVCCLIGVKSSFRYFDALYLPYVMRAYQDANTFPYLSLLALNPIIVTATTLTGAITILTGKFHPVTSMIVGSFVGGMAPLFMAVGPYIWNIIMYVIATSVGEVIWAPISYAYLVSLTGDGDEGAWMALAGMPVFLAKMLTGSLTGGLMSRFCPDPHMLCPPGGDDGPRFDPSRCSYVNGTSPVPTPAPPQFGGDPRQCSGLAVWGIIGLTTMTSFFALFFLRKFLRGPITTLQRVELEDPGSNDDLFPDEDGEGTADFEVTAAVTVKANVQS